GVGVNHTFAVVMNTAVNAFRVGIDVKFVIVIGEGLRHRIHAVVAADTVVEKHPAVATGAATDVLANTIGHQRGVVNLLQVTTKMIKQRVAKHREISARDKKGFSGSAGG